MQSNHIKPEVNYREFRIHKLNTPEFSHVRLFAAALAGMQ